MRSIQRHEVFTPGRLPIAANEVPALDGIPEHMHEYLELAVVSRGYGLHRTRGNATRLEPGSVILIRPGTWHAYWEPDELWTFNVYLGPELLHRDLSWLVRYPSLSRALLQGTPNLGVLGPESLTAALALIGQLAGLRPGEHVARAIGLTGAVIEILTENVPSVSRQYDDDAAETVVRMMQLMQSDLAHGWTISELAQRLNVSAPLVHRLFKAHVGLPPMAWLMQARGESAATQLASSTASVAAVGRSVGWEDPNYASRRFRALYGMSPREYRRRFASPSVTEIPF
ncbi:AraC family transcriptional regulator [Leifsonia sp. TF02-11]|uniref:AraC family transcriptional regulator n=1 Tax=Leifsonia sp. TF02-11 TaxID=2815212 RepID=UPI001AA1732D|nr:AraC family transcriptional regulator [Leifsonia sp. TF02-11]MBN9630276.1 AraC family transcriptional regulator [Actinomycetota bacterium]MBO1739325.1 AraC family transcriptional regulator [Leifsonia sp. TF02-11]